MHARETPRPRLVAMFPAPDESSGSRRALAVLVSRRFDHHFGRAAVTFMDHSPATGPTTCRRRCVTARCAQRFLSACAREMFLYLKAGTWKNPGPKTSHRR